MVDIDAILKEFEDKLNSFTTEEEKIEWLESFGFKIVKKNNTQNLVDKLTVKIKEIPAVKENDDEVACESIRCNRAFVVSKEKSEEFLNLSKPNNNHTK